MDEQVDSSRRRFRPSGIQIVLAVWFVGAVVCLIAWPVLRKPPAPPVVCGPNMRGLALAMVVYANDGKGALPPGDKWCDLLVGLHYVPLKQFVCRQSDAIEGESSYAINKYVAGKSLKGVPPDTVLLFETDWGIDPNGRTEPIRNRACYKMGSGIALPRQRMVYKGRWNLAGGPEMLTTKYHGGSCPVVFVDASVKWVKTEDLPKLKFKPDPNEADEVH